MKSVFNIRFGKSSSVNYKKAINYAKKFSNFTPLSEESDFNSIIVDNQELKSKIKAFENLWLTVSGWKSSELKFNEKDIDYNSFRQIIEIFNCSDKYNSAVIQENHCKKYNNEDGWGCKYLSEIEKDISNNYYWGDKTYWYEFGNFESLKIWKIDKEKLENAIKREVELKNIFLCEIFNFKKVSEIIKKLPDHINLEVKVH